MRSIRATYKGLAHVYCAFLLVSLIFTLGAIGSTASAAAEDSSSESTASGPIDLLFVQSAEDLEVDAATGTFRLVDVNPQTLYFSDRPYRIAGHLTMDEYLEEWTEKAGKDNLGADPPNATISVYEPGQADTTLAVVEISHPVVDGDDLIYTYKVIDGTLPVKGGQTALFIDKIGVGGGVGVGYHGVGVGRRGPGVR